MVYNIETKKRLAQRGYAKNPKTKQIFNMWRNLMARCSNPKHPSFKDYGGRGIKVCERWQSFENFLSDNWEDYYSYKQLVGDSRKKMTIDRIDNNGNYEFNNVRFVSQKVQCSNKRPSRDKFVTYNGKTQNLKQWAKEYRLNSHTLNFRLNKLKWSFEKAIKTPIKKNSRWHKI